MYLRTLGGLTLEGAGFQRPKPLLLLAYLALEGPTERRYLSELLWMDAANARRSLTMALSQLRAGAPGATGSNDARVWADVDCDATELLRAVEERDWWRTVELHRGPFLEGLEDVGSGLEIEEWIYRTREMLAQCVCTALLALAEQAAKDDDFREAGAWATRARALADTAPLAPHDLGRLYALLLAAERPHLGPVREEAQALGLELPSSAAAAREAFRKRPHPASSDTLPARATSFVGRQHELEQLTRWLDDPAFRLVSLVGVGGTGKTRLALQLATEAARAGGWDGVHFVPLETLRQSEEVAVTIADALGIGLNEPGHAVREIRRVVGASRTLMVLDNFEHVLTAAPLLAELTEGCPSLRLVVTSRERLNLDQEHSLVLGGLSVPATESVSAEEALRHDAVSLFVQRARRARPDFSLDPDRIAPVVRIGRLVGGMPLAIEMAAAWTGVMSIPEIVEEIGRGLDVLESPSRDLPERHKSIRFAFEHSWQLLSSDEQRVMRSLSVFRGGFHKDAAASVAGIGPFWLRTLVDRSLLSWNAVGRYELHPLWHQFLDEKGALEPDEVAEARERHATYFLERAAAHRHAFPHEGAGRAVREIEADLANIMAGWEWATDRERLDLLENAINPLGWFFALRGRPQQGLAWSDIATNTNPESLLTTRLLMWRATYLKDLGATQAANQYLERAAPMAERLGAYADLATILRITGLAHIQSDPANGPGAMAAFRRALALHEQLNDIEGIAMMLNNLAYWADDFAEARALLQRGLDMARQAGETHAFAMAASSLAELLAWSLGDYEAGLAAARDSLAAHEETGFTSRLADAHVLVAEILVLAGDPAVADIHVKRALDLASSLQGGIGTATRGGALALLGQVERLRGRLDSAVELYQRSIQLIQDGPFRGVAISAMGTSLNGLARVALVRGTPDMARSYATKAVAFLTRHEAGGSFSLTAMRLTSHVHLGESLMLEGKHDEAEDSLQNTLRLAMEAQKLPAILDVLLAVGRLRHEQGRDRLAGTIASAVAAHSASPYEVAERARALLAELPSGVAPSESIESPLADLIARVTDVAEDPSSRDDFGFDSGRESRN